MNYTKYIVPIALSCAGLVSVPQAFGASSNPTPVMTPFASKAVMAASPEVRTEACTAMKGLDVARPDPIRLRVIAGLALSVGENVLSITPEQQDEWQRFSAAVMAFLPNGKGLAELKDPDRAETAEAFAGAELLADIALSRTDAAKELKAAVVALRRTLSPEQQRIAKELQGRMRQRVLARLNGGPSLQGGLSRLKNALACDD